METADAVSGEAESEKITLSTIHQAKGLEWKVVFLIWLTEGMFPSARSVENPEGLEEETKAVLRGAHPLQGRALHHLSRHEAERRILARHFKGPRASLSEIPENLLETWEMCPSPRFQSEAGRF